MVTALQNNGHARAQMTIGTVLQMTTGELTGYCTEKISHVRALYRGM